LRLSGLAEVERWVLGWGGDARVIEPRPLRQAVAEAARRILQANSENRSPAGTR